MLPEHAIPLSDRSPQAAVVADELEQLSRALEKLADHFCSDPGMLARHGEAMQSFDLFCQLQRSLAAVLRARSMAEAIDGCVLGALADRMRVHPAGAVTPH